MGFLSSDGFAVPININPSILGNMLVMNEDDLNRRLQEQADNVYNLEDESRGE